ncbi:MAG: RluA family pseudouridine synthase [Myxococcaceae bacterium]
MSTGEPRELSVPKEGAGKRLDLFVGEALSLSRAQLRDIFDEERVRVDGRKAKKGQKVEAGQKVSVVLPVQAPAKVVPEPDGELVVLASDDALIALDKPAGRPSHPLKPGETGTLANALIARFPECAEASEDPREAGLCHRLDIETSGVILAARSKDAWLKAREAFSSRSVDKRYWALVSGPLADEGEIELPLRHHPRHPDRVEPDLTGEGREAFSKFRVLARQGELSLIEVQILTGVLHQVRAHLAAIGAPLVGDVLYGGKADPALGRFFLHARHLSLPHPNGGKPFQAHSPLPHELIAALARHQVALP